MQLDAVAHRNHDFGALVVVEDVMNRVAGTLEDHLGIVRCKHACAATSRIQGELQRHLRLGNGEFIGRILGQGRRHHPLRLHDQLAILHVEANARVGLVRVGVFAGERVELRRRRCRGLLQYCTLCEGREPQSFAC